MRADIQKYNPEAIAKPLGLYSHVARAKATEYLHIAGQISFNSAGELVGAGDFEAQMRQIYANLRAALESAGAGFDSVVKYTTYLTRQHRRDLRVGPHRRWSALLRHGTGAR